MKSTKFDLEKFRDGGHYTINMQSIGEYKDWFNNKYKCFKIGNLPARCLLGATIQRKIYDEINNKGDMK